jgi:predicted amidohydrolase YtcJ
VPEQKISVAQAVTAYTINNAWAGKQEQDFGTIEPSKLANIVILSDNIFTNAAEDIIDTKVTLTMIGGEVMCQLQ